MNRTRNVLFEKAVVFGGAIDISVFLMFSMSIAGVINPDHFLDSNLKVETEGIEFPYIK